MVTTRTGVFSHISPVPSDVGRNAAKTSSCWPDAAEEGLNVQRKAPKGHKSSLDVAWNARMPMTGTLPAAPFRDFNAFDASQSRF